MRDTTLSVDEGIDANVEYLCVVIEIPGGGVVECELTATVSPVAGTASMHTCCTCTCIHGCLVVLFLGHEIDYYYVRYNTYMYIIHSVIQFCWMTFFAIFLVTDLLPGKEDYVDGVYTIPIPPNSGSLDEFCIDIRDFIIDDHILESNETFDITLQSVTPCGEVGSESNTVVEIIDNDSKAILFLTLHLILACCDTTFAVQPIILLYFYPCRTASRICQLRVFTGGGYTSFNLCSVGGIC